MRKWLYLVLSLLLTGIMASCSKEPSPEERFSQYIKLWNGQKFDQMYSYLSEDAKDSITKEEFVNRYNKIYKDLEIHNLNVKFKKPKEDKKRKKEETKASFPFSAKMDSAAGTIAFEHKAKLVKEERDKEENWYIDWDTTYIFPELEEGDKISFSNVSAKRGEIHDRNGQGLAVNGIAYEIGVVPEQLGSQKDQTIAELAGLLEMSVDQINKALNAKWVQPSYFVPLKTVSTENQDLLTRLFDLEGVVKKDTESRVYPLGEAASHLIGYVGPVTADDLEKLKGKGYSSSDIIGKRGLEQVFEEQLKGQNGITISIQKEDGSVAMLAEEPVEDGKDIQLTIDADLQAYAYQTMHGEAGTAAAINPVTGETLGLISSPGFNPNEMVLGISAERRKALEDNPLQPLLNRFKHTYAPGSVMKPITAAVGLSSGKIKPDQTFDIQGLKWQKDKSWGSKVVTRVNQINGPVNLEKAIVFSDNIYFARTALAMGKDSFVNGLKEFGFEEKIPYVYPLEFSSPGKIDSEGMLADSGYGQGQVEMNVLHLAATYTPFVTNGNMIKPILQADEEKGQVWKEGLINPETATLLAGMMEKVISNPKGTGRDAQIPGYPLAGKTGTAELKLKQGESGAENGWFVAYNVESPSLLVAMMIENVEKKGGSKAATTRVKDIFTFQKP